jgi:NTP pyrophosphatase (non-canonical NTP hydrolase)
MADAATSVAELKELVRQFVAERAWEPFHTPKNLAMGMAVEAAELMEHFLWLEGPAAHELARDPARRNAIAEELADVLAHVINFSLATGIDLSDALRHKMAKNALKYPADQYRGRFSVP